MNKLIIFDLDGTLADTRADLAAAVNMTRGHYGAAELDYREIVSYIGNGAGKLIERSFTDRPDFNVSEGVDVFKKYYAENLIGQTELYPGVKAGLKELNEAGYKMAVYSNKPGELCRELSAHFELDDCFVTVMGGGDAAELKPDPAGLDDIIEKAESAGFISDGSNIWMVGDHYTDLKFAENGGINSIFCNYGFGNRKGLIPGNEVDNFSEIAGIIG